MKNSVISHYNMLIEHENDPFRDPEPLKKHMNKWDGDIFIEKLELDITKTALEIGIGTGRLADRTAPFCNKLYGIDVSPKTIERAKLNLSKHINISPVLGDFMTYDFDRKFDVIYSSLTFMHIIDKQNAIKKVSELLNNDGRFVLSIDKSKETVIDAGYSKIDVFPDNPADTRMYIESSGLYIEEQLETEFAHIFAAVKGANHEQPKHI